MFRNLTKKPSSEHYPAKEPDRSSATLNGHFFYKPVAHVSLIVLFGLLAYFNTFNVPFHFDDTPNIVENHRIKDISNIPSFFTDIEGPPISGRPLTVATFAINYYLGGLDATGYHIFNLALHIANGILLYFLIILTAGRLGFHNDKKTVLIALFSSLMFISHPIQTESVTYIVSRSVLLSTFFFFLGIILFAKAAGAEGKRKLLALFIISLMGMASREEFFLFPIMLILYDLYFISKQDIKRVLRNYKIHLPVIFTLAYVIYIVLSYDYGEHAGFGVKTITPLEYLMTQFNVHWTYIRLLFFPINQNLDYDYPVVKTLFELPTIISFIGYIGLWATGIYLYKKKPVISFCILWFMITIAPSSSIIPVADVIFEHRLYLPSVGSIIVFTTVIFYILQFIIYRSQILLTTGYLLLTTIVIALSGATYARNIIWQDAVSLWGQAAAKSPNKARPWINIGNAYIRRNLPAQAIPYLMKAIELNPKDSDAWTNIGAAYINHNLIGKAIPYLMEAIELNPKDSVAWRKIGLSYLRQNLPDKAIPYLLEAIHLDPSNPEAWHNIGIAYLDQNLQDKAIPYLMKAIELDTGNAEAWNSTGVAYLDQNLPDKAFPYFIKAIELNPIDAKAWNNMGIAYGVKNFQDKGIPYLKKAIELNPEYGDAYFNLGMAYYKTGDLNNALDAFLNVLEVPSKNQLVVSANKMITVIRLQKTKK